MVIHGLLAAISLVTSSTSKAAGAWLQAKTTHVRSVAANLTQWRKRAERAGVALAKLREATQSSVVHLRHDGETVGAGALAGIVRGAFEGTGKDYSIPLPGGIKLAPEMAIGGTLLLLAFSGQTDASADFHALGSGVMSFGSGMEAYTWMRNRKAVKAAGPANGKVDS